MKKKEIKTIRSMTMKEFQAEIKKQGVPFEKVTFRCPMCGTLQSATDLINAGAGSDIEAVKPYLGYSCVGRFNPQPQIGCDWTLGGLFQMHELVVITEDGNVHPRFLPISKEEHEKREKEVKEVKEMIKKDNKE